MFPAPKGRNGRHYPRQDLAVCWSRSGFDLCHKYILCLYLYLYFRQQLAAQSASRNCAYTAAAAATE